MLFQPDLSFPLGCRYGVDNNTADEIRGVTFELVVKDLQVCANQPLSGLGEFKRQPQFACMRSAMCLAT